MSKKYILPLFIAFEKDTQVQQNLTNRFPVWVWILIALIVVAVGVIWTLREEDETKKKQTESPPAPKAPPSPPEPVAVPPEETVVESEPAPPEPTAAPEPVAAPPEESVSEAKPEAEVEPAPAPAESQLPPKPDDLTKVRGIGPKIKQILNEQGIYTFEQLAATEVSFLEDLMEEQGWHMATYTTWAEQARELARQKKS